VSIRPLALVCAVFCVSLGPTLADDPFRRSSAETRPEPSEADVVYEDVKQALANKVKRIPSARQLLGIDGEAKALAITNELRRVKSARLELDYWYRHRDWIVKQSRATLKTKDGKAAEVLLLRAPALSMPGTDFSMAFLLVDNQLVDWASCWSHNRTAQHEALLEDVDDDGFPDLAFRAKAGWWGLQDERKQTRPNDKRTWLYAYAITSQGFKSLFPDTHHTQRLKLDCNTGQHAVSLQVTGLPGLVREYQMYECTISATNTGTTDLAIEPGEWFKLDLGKDEGWMTFYGPDKPQAVIKPGQTISQNLRFLLHGKCPVVTMGVKFAASEKAACVP